MMYKDRWPILSLGNLTLPLSVWSSTDFIVKFTKGQNRADISKHLLAVAGI